MMMGMMIYIQYKSFAYINLLFLYIIIIIFSIDEYLKSLARDKRYDGKESFIDILASSMIAKFVASGITYPHEVLRARLQDSKISYRLQQTSGVYNCIVYMTIIIIILIMIITTIMTIIIILSSYYHHHHRNYHHHHCTVMIIIILYYCQSCPSSLS